MTTNAPNQPLSKRARLDYKSRMPFVICASAWILNVTLLLTLLFWVAGDGQSPQNPAGFWVHLGLVNELAGKTIASDKGEWTAKFGLVAASGSFLLMLLGLLFGPLRFRNMRSWLLAMGIACCWCGMIASWSNLYWKGQQLRLRRVLPQATTLAQRLNSNWPIEDGELTEVGAFMAYPKRAPLSLLMLGECCLPDTTVGFSSIEKTGNDVIRFELTSKEKGAWLEWRSDNLDPHSFTGGLETQHKVLRYERLNKNWFLVRYTSKPD